MEGRLLVTPSASSGVKICVGSEARERYLVESGSAVRVLIKLAQGCQSGTFSQIALIPAINGIAKNKPGRPQSSSQNKHARITVVALSSMLRPMTTGTIT